MTGRRGPTPAPFFLALPPIPPILTSLVQPHHLPDSLAHGFVIQNSLPLRLLPLPHLARTERYARNDLEETLTPGSEEGIQFREGFVENSTHGYDSPFQGIGPPKSLPQLELGENIVSG